MTITADDVANRVAALHAINVDPVEAPHTAVQRLYEMNLGLCHLSSDDKVRMIDLIADAHRLMTDRTRVETIGRAA